MAFGGSRPSSRFNQFVGDTSEWVFLAKVESIV